MGDRTWCTLNLEGILSAEHLDELVGTLVGADAQGSESELRRCLLEGTPSFDFEEVNYAQLDDDLADLLKKLHLSYAWSWDAGGEYGAGVTLYDARRAEEIDLDKAGNDICLTLRAIDQEGHLEKVRVWDRFYRDKWRFQVYTSNHDLLSAKADGKLPDGYFELIQRANQSEESPQ